MEGVGIISANGSVNAELAASMLWPNSMDAIDDCAKDQEGLFDNKGMPLEYQNCTDTTRLRRIN